MRSLPLSLAAALLLAPAVLAHTDGSLPGSPKSYCEPTLEWTTHDYFLPGSLAAQAGVAVVGPFDGSVQDCDNAFAPPVTAAPVPCLHVALPWIVPGVAPCGVVALVEYDGHAEFGIGGAVILVDTGAGVPSSGPTVPAGTLYCFGEAGHHVPFGPVTVVDVTQAATVSFIVGADHVDATGLGDGCGDYMAETLSPTCVGSCAVAFGPGLDGAYFVFVEGDAGHVDW